jgi:methionyl-tRNA formyltransferase
VNVVFCGSPELAVPTLQQLLKAGFAIPLVVTQPDLTRGVEVIAPPVKRFALELGIPVLQPEKIKNNETFRAELERARPDAVVVFSYGRLIPKWMIDLPPLGNINLHASLLPKYRGAAPIQWAIANGDAVTGVSTILIDEDFDTGDILLQREEPVLPDDTVMSLALRLAHIGADLVIETLHGLNSHVIKPVPQDGSRATYAPLPTRADGRLDWRRTSQELYNRLRGFQPWVPSVTTFRGKQLMISAAMPAPHAPAASAAAGEIIVEQQRLFAMCGGDSALEILGLHPEGENRISAKDFIVIYEPAPGERFGPGPGEPGAITG